MQLLNMRKRGGGGWVGRRNEKKKRKKKKEKKKRLVEDLKLMSSGLEHQEICLSGRT